LALAVNHESAEYLGGSGHAPHHGPGRARRDWSGTSIPKP